MGQTLCRVEFTGSSRETICEFREWWIVSEIFTPTKDNWIPFGIHSTSLLLLLVVWFLSFRCQRNDFSRSFVMTALAILTILSFCRFLLALNEKLNFLCREYRCMEENNVFAAYLQIFITSPEKFLQPVTYFFLSTSIMFFLFMVSMMAKSKEPKSGSRAWAPFVAVLVVSILLASCISFVEFSQSYLIVKYLPHVLHVVIVNIIFLLIIIFCQRFSCFSSSQREEEEVEGLTSLTFYKRSLRLSSILFTLSSSIPLVGHLIVVDFFSNLGQYIGAPSSPWFLHTKKLFDWLTPIFFCLSVILCLPSYRPCYRENAERREDYVVKEE